MVDEPYPLNTPEREALVRGNKRVQAGEDELIEDGQEEVFAKAEVERGEIEHQSAAGCQTEPSR